MVMAANLMDPDPSDDPSWELKDRLTHIWKMRWVDYPVGTAALEALTRLYHLPANLRPPCLLVYGDSNNGKTSICKKFARDMNGTDDTGTGIRRNHRPVLMIVAPGTPDLGGLLDAILRALNGPSIATARTEAKYDQVLRLLKNLGLRVLIIDEIHHVLPGRVDQRAVYLNSLKALSSELGISVVAVGVHESQRAFQTDQQMGSRFSPIEIPRWRFCRDYALFLARLYDNMGLAKESNFRSRELVSRFHSMTEGLTGETWQLMATAAEAAIKAGKEMVDVELLAGLRWEVPSERRRSQGRLV